MVRDLNKYIKQVNFDKQYKKLVKRYKNKKIVIYGGGQLFRIINEKYDLSKLNIIGICDRYFEKTDTEKTFLGYNKIVLEDLRDCGADVILTGTLEYIHLIENLKDSYFYSKKIIIRPLIYITVGLYLKELIFGKKEK